ncbi:MAG: hypothetical protein QOI11_2899 [Candidatus Eremiobacteraeota bacterium]|jgi:V8-like Glu-specific endopeptidase|nr:hypothetical protein [Candidatus Eremiobacteraeota bacterium]
MAQLFRQPTDETTRRFIARTAARRANLSAIASGQLLNADAPNRVQAFLERRGFTPEEATRAIRTSRRVATVRATESVGVAEDFGLERILGTSDLMGIAFLELGLDVAKTVGRIWADVAAGRAAGYATGFLISPRLLMTNHHVLGDPSVASRSLVQFDYELDARGVEAPSATFRTLPGVFHLASKELDYAVVAVEPEAADGTPLSRFGWNRLIAEEGKAIIAQWLNIVQHPDAGYKQLALRENQLVDVADAFLHYMTDTACGSSGSPVYNDRWEVVALHHSGVPAKDSQGRILTTDGRIWTADMGESHVKWIANEGIRASRLVADLKSRALTEIQKPLLDEALNGPPCSPDRQEFRPEPTQIREERLMSDGSVSITVPLTLTLSLGGKEQRNAPQTSAPAAVAPPLPDAGSSSGSQTSPAAAGSIEAAVSAAREALIGRADVLDVRSGYVFKDGWITDERAVVVTVKKRLTPEELSAKGIDPVPARFAGYKVEIVPPTLRQLFDSKQAPSGAELLEIGAEITYVPPPGAKLEPLDEEMSVVAHVSPEEGWKQLRPFIAATRRELVIGIYDFTAPHIVDEMVAAVKGQDFEDITLVMQAGESITGAVKKDDLTDQETVDELEKSAKRSNATFQHCWVKLGSKNGWVSSAYHIKVIVRDKSAIWLSSGNLQSSNQPADLSADVSDNLKKYNREWHAIVENQALAETYRAFIENDYKHNGPEANELLRLPAFAVPDVALAGPLLELEAARNVRAFLPFKAHRAFRVTPLLTPDNYHQAALDLIKSAKKTLLIQNQSFNAPKDGQDALQEILNAVLERKKANVDVRIIFRLFMPADARANLEGLKELGFDPNKELKVQANCHTKAIIADGARVMLGSQNISNDGVSNNRDASLLFDDEPLAAYFMEIFEHDWANLATRKIGAQPVGPELLEAGTAPPAGMTRLSLSDVREFLA